MGQLVYVLGRSGTGKSFSMRNFPKEKVAVVNVQGKILPFRGSAEIEQTATDLSDRIIKALKIYAADYKSIIVDDYQYVMANEFMRRSTERGYDKFTEIGRHAWDIANTVRELPQDVIVYVLCHTDRDDEGNEKIKTIGKLLDEKICLEGMSTIVLKTNVTDGQYSFLTQNNGKDTVKSPAGMFPSYAIDNDLYYVDQKIRNYYSLGEFITDEEAAQIDEMAKKEDTPIREPGEKKSRKRKGGSDEEKEKSAKAPAEKAEEEASAGDAEPPKRERKRRSVTEELHEEMAETINADTAHLKEGEVEEVPFDEASSEIKELPKRKRRDTSAVAEETKEDVKAETKAEPTQEEPAQEAGESTEEPTRRRRRRG